MKRAKKPVKRNNAHLVPKDKLVLDAYNMSLVMIHHQPGVRRLPVGMYSW